MKTINYKGVELACIESGYWPAGVTLVNGSDELLAEICAICLHNGRAMTPEGRLTDKIKYWALLPPKPAPLRLTNRELAGLARKGYDVLWYDRVCLFHDYYEDTENDQCSENVKGVRAPNTDEWLEPTSDLLEVAK